MKCPTCGHECATSTCPVCNTKIRQLPRDPRAQRRPAPPPPPKPLSELEKLRVEFRSEESNGFIDVDYTHKVFLINHNYYRFAWLLDFNVYETDGGTEIKQEKHGLGRAVAGGILFGPIGAIVGGTTGKTEVSQTNFCDSLRLEIALKDAPKQKEEIIFIYRKTDKSDWRYKDAVENARSCAALLQRIQASIQPQSQPAPAPFSAADEILKFKNLADAGIITQEEFEQKKQQLLGL